MYKKIDCIIQARCSSSRLPEKIFYKICNKSILEHLIKRVKKIKKIRKIIIATTVNPVDNKIKIFAKKKKNIFF